MKSGLPARSPHDADIAQHSVQHGASQFIGLYTGRRRPFGKRTSPGSPPGASVRGRDPPRKDQGGLKETRDLTAKGAVDRGGVACEIPRDVGVSPPSLLGLLFPGLSQRCRIRENRISQVVWSRRGHLQTQREDSPGTLDGCVQRFGQQRWEARRSPSIRILNYTCGFSLHKSQSPSTEKTSGRDLSGWPSFSIR